MLCMMSSSSCSSTDQVQPSSSPLVFLGGSCNPTTWRQEIAIPFLESEGLSYYNPQVSEWKPECVFTENRAKRDAEVLFFVLDNQTRSTSAMIEVAYALGRGQPLVLVVNNYSWPGVIIDGEAITEREYFDLQTCQKWLTDLAVRHGVQVYTDIKVALRETARRLRDRDFALQKTLQRLQPSSPASLLPSDKGRKVLLFFISNHRRSLIEMISIGYFLGKQEKCVICIKELPTKACIEGETLSPNAIKDYNRGRAYLADLANSSGVAELFTSVKEAVTQYIKLQSSNNSSSLSSSLLSTSLSLSSSMSSPSQTNAWHELQCRQGRGIGSNHQF